MTAYQYLSFVATLIVGVACMLLAARGLKRTKKRAFFLLFLVSAALTMNEAGRPDEYGDRKTDSPTVRTHKGRAIGAPLVFLMLAAALWSLQADEKKG
jgi:hypothetical protein